MSSRPKVAFVGNCQAEQLSEIFSLAYPNASIVRIPPVHEISDNQKNHILSSISSCDIVCAHYISDAYPIKWVSTSHLRLLLGNKLVLLTNIHSRMLNTQSCDIRLGGSSDERLQGPLGGVHLSSILDSYLRKLTPEDAVCSYQAYDGFSDEDVLCSINELVRRDKDFGIDIPFAHPFFLSKPARGDNAYL
jgi:hypothetical protein